MIDSSKYFNIDEFYGLYESLRLHFTTSYDYFKYNGKTKRMGNLKNKRDKNFVYRLHKKYGEEFPNFLICMFSNLRKEDMWAGFLNDAEKDEIYNKWKSKMSSLHYHFEKEMIHLKSFEIPFDEMFKTKTNYPFCFTRYIKGELSLESLIIMDLIIPYFHVWEVKMKNDFIWKEFNFKCKKYKPFLTIRKEIYKNIMKKIFINN